jgi:Flp pilus assembly protein TadD
MRTPSSVLHRFAGAAALTSLVACDPPKPPPPRPPVEAPASTPAPVVTNAPPTPKVTPPGRGSGGDPVAASDAVVDEGALRADELISGAREALGLGELERALRLARLSTKRAPNRAQAWNTLGRVQLRRGERKDAIDSFEHAVELNPSSSYAQNNLGLALIYDGRYEDAVDALEEATELEPVEGYMWNNLGMAYEHLDRLDDARAAYRQALELKGDRATANLARLKGVQSVLRTAKVTPGTPPGTSIDLPMVAPRDGGLGEAPAVPTGKMAP